MIDLEKIQREAPHMVSLVKGVGVSLEKHGFNASDYQAAVIATIDHSGSTEDGYNNLYSDGTMQRVCDMAFAAALVFDDDGQMPLSLFSNSVNDFGDIELSNCDGFINRAHRRVTMSGTNYVGALQWIVEKAGYSHVNLGGMTTQKRGLFGRRSNASSSLSVKATAPYPTYAIFVTDGEPNHGTEEQIVQCLTLMSQLPIFVQFVGVGRHHFTFLRDLDEMDGRFVDNANFFDSKEATSPEVMLEKMLGEFPDYYAKARGLGLIG